MVIVCWLGAWRSCGPVPQPSDGDDVLALTRECSLRLLTRLGHDIAPVSVPLAREPGDEGDECSAADMVW
jgi:hypothetical protein